MKCKISYYLLHKKQSLQVLSNRLVKLTSLICRRIYHIIMQTVNQTKTGLSSMLIFFIFSGYRSCRHCMNFAFCANFENFIPFNYASSFVYPSVPERIFPCKLFLRIKISDSNECRFDDSMSSFSNSCSS